jgi:hypothetical protein
MKNVVRTLGLPCLSLLVIACGCRNEPAVVQITGKVTFEGTALKGGSVSYFPEEGQFVAGNIDSEGSYTLSVPPGHYRVAITETIPLPANWKDGDPLPTEKPRVPARFGNVKSSGLEVTVDTDSSTKSIDFPLE